MIPKKGGQAATGHRGEFFGMPLQRAVTKKGGWAGKCKGGLGGSPPQNRLALPCTMSGGRAKNMGGVGAKPPTCKNLPQKRRRVFRPRAGST